MKIVRIYAVIVVLLTLVLMRSGRPDENPFEAKATDGTRTWSDASGKFKVEAKLDSVNGNAVKLVKKDGTTVEVPLDKLSEEDKSFVRTHAEEKKASKDEKDERLAQMRKEHVSWRVRTAVTRTEKVTKSYTDAHGKLYHKDVLETKTTHPYLTMRGELVSYVDKDVTIALNAEQIPGTHSHGSNSGIKTYGKPVQKTFDYGNMGEDDCRFLDKYRKVEKGESPTPDKGRSAKSDKAEK